jgi:GTP cyclohydrolase I
MGKNITVTDSLALSNMIIDDIYDSGATRARYQGYAFEVLFDKKDPLWKDQWLVMPWEHTDTVNESATDIVTRLLQYIGEDPTREGLQDTPQRVLKAWKEWAWGYDQDPKAVLKTFEDGAENVDEMVVVHNIPIISKCEHHLADITGIAHIGYIPDGKIVGLSKLPRLAEIFSRRLQVQERLTNQIADTLQTCLNPLGVGVVLRASHACMATRGVNIQGSVTTTSAMRGALLDTAATRAEFLALCRDAEK